MDMEDTSERKRELSIYRAHHLSAPNWPRHERRLASVYPVLELKKELMNDSSEPHAVVPDLVQMSLFPQEPLLRLRCFSIHRLWSLLRSSWENSKAAGGLFPTRKGSSGSSAKKRRKSSSCNCRFPPLLSHILTYKHIYSKTVPERELRPMRWLHRTGSWNRFFLASAPGRDSSAG
jgi:hypothetical protein